MKNEAKIINLAEHIQNNLKIESGNMDQSTKLDLIPKANLSKRAYALLIDLAGIVFINYLIFSAYAVALESLFPALSGASKFKLSMGNMTLNVTIFLITYWTYFFYSSFIMNGKTLGKKMMGLTIIDESFATNHIENDYHIDIRQCFQRASGYLLCYLSFGTFFIFNFASEDNRGLADYLSSTRTVDDNWLNSMLEHKDFASEEVRIDIPSLKKAA